MGDINVSDKPIPYSPCSFGFSDSCLSCHSITWPPAGTVPKPIYTMPEMDVSKGLFSYKDPLHAYDFNHEVYRFLGFSRDVSSSDLAELVNNTCRSAEERLLACSLLSRSDHALGGTGYYYLITCEEIGVEYKRVAFEQLVCHIRDGSKWEGNKKMDDFLDYPKLLFHLNCIIKLDTVSVLDKLFLYLMHFFIYRSSLDNEEVEALFKAFKEGKDIENEDAVFVALELLGEDDVTGKALDMMFNALQDGDLCEAVHAWRSLLRSIKEIKASDLETFRGVVERAFRDESTHVVFKIFAASILCSLDGGGSEYFEFFKESFKNATFTALLFVLSSLEDLKAFRMGSDSLCELYMKRVFDSFETLGSADRNILIFFLDQFFDAVFLTESYPGISKTLEDFQAKKVNWKLEAKSHLIDEGQYKELFGCGELYKAIWGLVARDMGEEMSLREMSASFLYYMGAFSGRAYDAYSASGYASLLEDEHWVGEERKYAILRVMLCDRAGSSRALLALRELKKVAAD